MVGKGGNVIKVILVVLFGNGIIVIVKFVVFVFIGFSVMLVEGLYLSVDIGN